MAKAGRAVAAMAETAAAAASLTRRLDEPLAPEVVRLIEEDVAIRHRRRVRLPLWLARRRCAFCEKQGELAEPRLRVCGACRLRSYCSRACQRSAWYGAERPGFLQDGPHREQCPALCEQYAEGARA